MPTHPRSASVLDDFRAYVALTGLVPQVNGEHPEKLFLAIWTSLEQGWPPQQIQARLTSPEAAGVYNLAAEAFERTLHERPFERNRKPVKRLWMRNQHACFSIGVFRVPIHLLIAPYKKLGKQRWIVHSNRGQSYICDGTLELGTSVNYSILDYAPSNPNYR